MLSRFVNVPHQDFEFFACDNVPHQDFEFFACDMVRSLKTPNPLLDRVFIGPRSDLTGVKTLPSLLDDVQALFPIFLKLAGRRCLVVGAGRLAEPKIESLLIAGAKVFLVAPKATSKVQRWAYEKKLEWDERPFELSDLEGVYLVVCATSSMATNQAVLEESHERGVFCSVLGEDDMSDFYHPTVVKRGTLQIAVSTAGESPALEQRLSAELERQYGPEYETWLQWLSKARASILADPLSPRRRRTLLRKLASQRGLEEFLRRRGISVNEKLATAK